MEKDTKKKVKELQERFKKELSFVERRFLNQGSYHTNASVMAKISEEDWGKYPDCQFVISDCNRTITLDIDSWSLEDLDNSIFKMTQLIETATLMKNSLKKVKPYVKEVKKIEQEEKQNTKNGI